MRDDLFSSKLALKFVMWGVFAPQSASRVLGANHVSDSRIHTQTLHLICDWGIAGTCRKIWTLKANFTEEVTKGRYLYDNMMTFAPMCFIIELTCVAVYARRGRGRGGL